MGHTPWNKGMTLPSQSTESNDKRSKKLKGRVRTEKERLAISAGSIGKVLSAEHVRKFSEAQMESYKFYNPEGVIVEFKGLKKFSKENNLNASHMSRVNRGLQSQHKGWRAA